MALAREHVLLSDGKSLESYLPVALWNGVLALRPTDRPLSGVSSLKLWMAIPALPLSQIATTPGVEPQLTLRARQEGKSITYLETMAEFAELADAIPEKTLHEALSITLAELKSAPRNFLDPAPGLAKR